MADLNKRDFNAQPAVVVSSRWNPTPEQLRTLEELYRRGTRTPTADQIQHITAQLRRYGKIEGKNVFYWFQNHKARERQKRRRQMESSTPDNEHNAHDFEIFERKDSGNITTQQMNIDLSLQLIYGFRQRKKKKSLMCLIHILVYPELNLLLRDVKLNSFCFSWCLQGQAGQVMKLNRPRTGHPLQTAVHWQRSTIFYLCLSFTYV